MLDIHGLALVPEAAAVQEIVLEIEVMIEVVMSQIRSLAHDFSEERSVHILYNAMCVSVLQLQPVRPLGTGL